MLVQPPTTPTRVPGKVPGMPVYWLENRDASTLALIRAAMSAEWNRIPAAIRDPFVAKRIDAQGQFNAFRFMAGRLDIMYDQFGQGTGRGPRDVQWSGLYQQASTSSRLYFHSAGTRTEYGDGGYSVVHEFGHHIDWTYNQIWLGYTDSRRYDRVSDRAEFAALWNAAYPTIPSALYGRTRDTEWFAELFRCQMQNDATTFFQLAGLDTPRARAIRALFVALLPMPVMSGY